MGGYTKSDEFSEKIPTAFDPSPPNFRKIIFQFFTMDMDAYRQGGKLPQVIGQDSMKCMHMISRDRDHSEGWGSTAV